MWSLVNQDLNRRRSLSKLHQKNSTLGGQDQKMGARSVQTSLTGLVTGLTGPSGGSVLGGHELRKKDGSAQTGLTVWRPVSLRALEKILETLKRKGRVSSNSWPSMRRKELLRNRRSNQIKLKI